MSQDELLGALTSSIRTKKEKKQKQIFLKQELKRVEKKLNESRHKFSKSKINEIRRKFYEIENEKSLFESKIKKIEKNLTELEENLSKTKKHYDDIEYRGTKSVKDLFDLSIDEYYYKPIIGRRDPQRVEDSANNGN